MGGVSGGSPPDRKVSFFTKSIKHHDLGTESFSMGHSGNERSAIFVWICWWILDFGDFWKSIDFGNVLKDDRFWWFWLDFLWFGVDFVILVGFSVIRRGFCDFGWIFCDSWWILWFWLDFLSFGVDFVILVGFSGADLASISVIWRWIGVDFMNFSISPFCIPEVSISTWLSFSTPLRF